MLTLFFPALLLPVQNFVPMCVLSGNVCLGWHYLVNITAIHKYNLLGLQINRVNVTINAIND